MTDSACRSWSSPPPPRAWRAAVAGLPVGAVVVARLGSRRATTIAFAVFAAALVAAGAAGTLAVLLAAVAVFALANRCSTSR
ncbi:hypothetical protein [Jiangella anatolica]|uniref:hypothetical protein n=1 Tax=Jiangella anatolica TaxID=2670374 RepID=UPI0011B46D9F|nr:hypothetical protein [Jiangella anatolica]